MPDDTLDGLTSTWALDAITRLERRLVRLNEFLDENLCFYAEPRLTPAQALLLLRIPARGCVVKELMLSGAYSGSNVSYNLRVLEEGKYLSYQMPVSDKRTRFVCRTEKGDALLRRFEELLRFNSHGRDLLRILAIEREVSRGIEEE